MNDFILNTEKVTMTFAGLTAVDHASLGLREESIHAIIGPNGAGKTTFFNLISGYYKPTAGRVNYKGEDITGLEPFEICKKGIIRTFQVAAIYPMLSVFENVQIASFCNQRRIYHLFSRAKNLCRDEVNDVLGKVGLTGQANALAGKLSQGDRKRLELAIVLANKPRVLLLDEPTAGMSPDETRQIMESTFRRSGPRRSSRSSSPSMIWRSFSASRSVSPSSTRAPFSWRAVRAR